MEDVIDNGREKFWRFAELNANMKDIFHEIACRNFEEIDPTTYFDSIKVHFKKIKTLFIKSILITQGKNDNN